MVLGARYWVLGTGCWVLGAGYWVVVIVACDGICFHAWLVLLPARKISMFNSSVQNMRRGIDDLKSPGIHFKEINDLNENCITNNK